jgi:hypothetical protein
MQCGIGPKLKQLDARHAFNQRPCAVSHPLFPGVGVSSCSVDVVAGEPVTHWGKRQFFGSDNFG